MKQLLCRILVMLPLLAVSKPDVDVHKSMSAECFNKCWTLIDKSQRTAEETDEMVQLAVTSLWHWKQRDDCKPINLSIGYWQVSRVYALAGEAGLSRRNAETSLQIGQKNKLPAFYIGYSYEALARAELVAGNKKEAAKYLADARKQLEQMMDKGEQNLFKADIQSLEKELSR